jgi:inosose dehydratase
VAGHSGLHKPGDFGAILAETRRVAELTAALGARHVIFVPVPGYRDDTTGAYLEPPELDADSWRTLISATNEIGRQIAQDYGIRLQSHDGGAA